MKNRTHYDYLLTHIPHLVKKSQPFPVLSSHYFYVYTMSKNNYVMLLTTSYFMRSIATFMNPFSDKSRKLHRLLGIAMIALAVVITTTTVFYTSASWRAIASDMGLHSTALGNNVGGATNNKHPYATPTAKTVGKPKMTPTKSPTKPTPTKTATPIPTTGTTPTPVTTQPTAQPTVASTPSPTTTPMAANPWQLIYNDDFNGSQLNPTWGTYNGPHGGGQSYYSPNEVSVSNGMLHLAMEAKVTNGLPYTTGGVAAFGLAQTYGRYVFRARLPLGKGVGPYAILWPQTATNNVETDLFESPPATKNEIFFTNHDGPGGTTTQLTAMNDFGNDFHTFDYQWTPGKITLTIDGTYIGALTVSLPNQPMWFGMAISSGDAFTGLPDASTVLPVTMDVDWVQIYKYTGQ